MTGVLALVMGVLLIGVGGPAGATSPQAAQVALGEGQGQGQEQHTEVTICHSGNGKNYEQITVDDDSIVNNGGHGGHPDDIIPPFDYIDEDGDPAHYPGKNWDEEGMAIWNNDW